MGNFGQALGTALPQAITNISNIQGIQDRQQRLKMEEENHMVNQAAANIDLAKKQREEAYNTRPIPLDAAFQQFAPNLGKTNMGMVSQELIDSGLAKDYNGITFITPENVNRYIKQKASETEFLGTIMKNRQADTKLQLDNINNILNDPKFNEEVGLGKPDAVAKQKLYIGQRDNIYKMQSEELFAVGILEATKGVGEGKIDAASLQEAIKAHNLGLIRPIRKPEEGGTSLVEHRVIGKNTKQDFRVYKDTNGTVIKEEKIGVPYSGSGESGAGGKITYAGWRAEVDSQLKALNSSFRITANEADNIDLNSPNALIAFLKGKGFTPEQIAIYQAGKVKLDKLREEGYQDIIEGRNPYERIAKKFKSKTSLEDIWGVTK